MYVQDETGGIKIYLRAESNSFALGDRIYITGYTKLHFGEPELSVPESQPIELRSSGTLIAPKVISAGTLAQHGGQLVQVSGHAESSSGEHWYLHDGTESIFVYHDADTDVKQPELSRNEAVSLIGIVGWSEKGPRLMPRNEVDLMPAESVESSDINPDIREGDAPQRLPVTGEVEHDKICKRLFRNWIFKLIYLTRKDTYFVPFCSHD